MDNNSPSEHPEAGVGLTGAVAVAQDRLDPDKTIENMPVGSLAGAAQVGAPIDSYDNPLAKDKSAAADGKKLFRTMNCASCHGYGAGGGMGPDLTDGSWRYGGTPIQIYQSISEGRSNGMPACVIRAVVPQAEQPAVSLVAMYGPMRQSPVSGLFYFEGKHGKVFFGPPYPSRGGDTQSFEIGIIPGI